MKHITKTLKNRNKQYRNPGMAPRRVGGARLLAAGLLLLLVVLGRPAAAQSEYFRTEGGLPYIPALSSQPTVTEAGAMYFNTADSKLYMYNGTKWMVVAPASDKPTVENINISGYTLAGETLTAHYSFVSGDVSGAAEGTSTFQWYKSTNASGTLKTAISGATSITLTVPDYGYYAIEVTPVASNNAIGEKVVSDFYTTNLYNQITPIVDITTASGRTWMDRNLGAERRAKSETDFFASGFLFQWGRKRDGHQVVFWDSNTTGELSTTRTSTIRIDAVYSQFVINNNRWWTFDTESLSLSETLWWNDGNSAINNPCPIGYHVPTRAEIQSEFSAGTNFVTDLYFVYTPARLNSGYLSNSGTPFLWTSTKYDAFRSYCANIDERSVFYYYMSQGVVVRCIKDE